MVIWRELYTRRPEFKPHMRNAACTDHRDYIFMWVEFNSIRISQRISKVPL
jgi:hypothetical protein